MTLAVPGAAESEAGGAGQGADGNGPSCRSVRESLFSQVYIIK